MAVLTHIHPRAAGVNRRGRRLGGIASLAVQRQGRVARVTGETTACFAKGTLVHTKEGLVPIEKLKVGDWVLSKPEDGTGELAYKRVTQTFAHGPTEVVNLLYQFGGINDSRFAEHAQYGRLTTTLNHPFWVVGQGWTEVGDLNQWPGEESRLVLANGQQAIVFMRRSIYQTSRSNIGWLSSIGNVTDVLGTEWDFENQCVHRTKVYAEETIQELNYPAILKIPVYNIEVEDFHTYFVGEEGVWVHNKTVSTAIEDDLFLRAVCARSISPAA